MNKLLLSAAMAGVFAAGVVASAHAADAPAAAAPAKVKCYGISAAGKNDCKGNNHSCAGKSTKANDPAEFGLVADKAACDAAKGKLEAPKS